MTDAILNAPIKVVATKNVIDQCKTQLQDILAELRRINSYKDMAEKDKYVLEMICQIIEAALEK